MQTLIRPATINARCAALFVILAIFVSPVCLDATKADSTSPVISQRQLSPALRGEIRQVRFSPDRSRILVQDAAGIYVLTRRPLAEVLWIPADGVLPAAFTPDSLHLVIASPQLQYVEVSALGPQRFAPQSIANPDGCLAAALSANGAMLGCISSNGMLKVYSMPGAKQIFSTQVPFAIDGIARPLNLNIIAPIGTASAFSEPVGDFRATHLAALAGLDNPARILFSPDGHYVIAGLNGRDAPVVGADLSTLHKISVPGELALHLRSDPAFISDSEFAFHDPAKPESSAILSFPEGKTLQQLPAFTRVTASTDGEDLFLANAEDSNLRIFDLRTARIEATIAAQQADIAGGEIASCDAQGNLVLSMPGGAPRNHITLSAGSISSLRIASPSPNLSVLAVGVGAGAAIFSTSTGERLAIFPSARAAWCSAEDSCYIGELAPAPKMLRIERWSRNAAEEKAHSAPFLQAMDFRDPFRIEQIIPSGPVVLEYAARISAAMPSVILMGPGGISTFRSQSRPDLGIHLRALSMTDGMQAWRRERDSDAPIPFSDPQGDRLVLGWSAKSHSGRDAAKRYPAAYERLKRAKLSPHDTFFEAIDDRTGNPVAGTLVQLGSGAIAFDSAFSEGNWLVLSKDGQRIFVISLKTGETKLTVFGDHPALSSAGDSLSFVSAPGQITIYDLTTLAKSAVYNFTAPVAYAHFSADGKRLLVLTSNQTVCVVSTAAGTTRAPAGARSL